MEDGGREIRGIPGAWCSILRRQRVTFAGADLTIAMVGPSQDFSATLPPWTC